jgi:GxxExxY protein
MDNLIYKDEVYQIIGLCMEVHRVLGRGMDEVVYKDALEEEFRRAGITFAREVSCEVSYKGVILPHCYFADFVVMDKIILEVKAVQSLTSSHIKQTMNYLAVSKLKLGILVNFGEDSLTYKRVIL